MFKCGITGSSGVLGRQLIKNLNFKYFIFNGRIEKKKDLQKWYLKNKLDLVIHLAAIVPTYKVNKEYRKAINVNFIGTKNLVDIINTCEHKPKWFFFSSTSHVYKQKNNKRKILENSKTKPNSKYGFTKLLAENYIKDNIKINYSIGRIFSYTHINQNKSFLIPSIKKKIKEKKLNLNNLNHYRDFIHVKDICSAINILWKKRALGTFNIGTSDIIYLKDIALMMKKKINKDLTLTFDDNKKSTFLVANIQKIKKLGWKPKYKINKILNDFLKKK